MTDIAKALCAMLHTDGEYSPDTLKAVRKSCKAIKGDGQIEFYIKSRRQTFTATITSEGTTQIFTIQEK